MPRIKKVSSDAVFLHEESQVKFKTAGNTREVQFSAGMNNTCLIQNISKDTYMDKVTGEMKKRTPCLELLAGNGGDGRKELLKGFHTERDGQERPILLTKGEQRIRITYGKDGLAEQLLFGDRISYHFTYDNRGNISSRTDGNGHTVAYRHDACGRLTETVHTDGSKRSCTYDRNGAAESLTREDGSRYELCYDGSGHLTGITGNGRRTRIFYDSCGRPEGILTGQGRLYRYEWQEHAEIEKGEGTGSAEKRYETVTFASGNSINSIAEETDGAGNIIQRTYRDGCLEQLTYDCRNRLQTLTTADGGTWQFTWDATGRCRERTDPYGRKIRMEEAEGDRPAGITDEAGDFCPFPVPQRAESETQGPGPVPEYVSKEGQCKPVPGILTQRDGCGRLTARTFPGGIKSRWGYGANGRVEQIIHEDGEGILESMRYTYGLMGECTGMQCYRRDIPGESGTYTYRHDSKGRLTGVEKDGMLSEVYSYDREGNLCYTQSRKKPEAVSTTLYREGTRSTCEVRRGKKHYTVHADGVPEAVLTEEGTYRYLLTDRMGSVLRVMTTEGQTESVNSYDAYGCSERMPEYAGYGGYLPAGEGIYAAGRRYYEPSAGSFLTADSWPGQADRPVTFNRYLYAAADPVDYRDSTGEKPEGSPLETMTAPAFPSLQGQKETPAFPELSTEGSPNQDLSGIRKGPNQTVHQETFLEFLDKGVERLVNSPVADVMTMLMTVLSMGNPLVSGGMVGECIFQGKSLQEVFADHCDFYRGVVKGGLMELPRQFIGIFDLIDNMDEIGAWIGKEGIYNAFWKAGAIMEEGIEAMATTLLITGTPKEKGEITAQLAFMIAESLAANSLRGADAADDVANSLRGIDAADDAARALDDIAGSSADDIARTLDDVAGNAADDAVDALKYLDEDGTTSVQHAVGSANQAQSVLDGIDPKYFNSESRFGKGFYVGGDGDTIIAELAEHGNTAKYAISYDMNLSGQKILDLTDPQIASQWDYVAKMTHPEACREIGALAKTQGYDAIVFESYRGEG